jgi:hypothetical protein
MTTYQCEETVKEVLYEQIEPQESPIKLSRLPW